MSLVAVPEWAGRDPHGDRAAPGLAPAAPKPHRPTRVLQQGELAGLPALVAYARFVAWAFAQPGFPQPEQVMARFGMGRSSAHRWLNALEEALGVPRPRRNGRGEVMVGGRRA